MLFTSVEFIAFVLLILPIYYYLDIRHRWALLLGASYFFYALWNISFVPLLMLSTLVDYFAALSIEKETSKKRRKLLLYLSLGINFSILIYFKYYVFLFDTFLFLVTGKIASAEGYSLLLPLGISFYTFQTVGYTLDVYWGRRPAEKKLGYFALFVVYFPQLIAGPIENSRKLIPQLKIPMKNSEKDFLKGLSLALWGFFKKSVIADNLVGYYSTIYTGSESFSSDALVFATILMTFVYYFDFSGYCDIAVGVSRMFGIKLSRNFALPYLSRTMGEVWKRWHITLSQWINQYLHFYLSRKKIMKDREWLVLMICFSLLGFWHGSNWNFFFFGFFHGVFVLADRKFVKAVSPVLGVKVWVQRIFSLFNILKVFFLWNLVGVFLISNDFKHALSIYRKIFFDVDYRIIAEDFSIYQLLINQGVDLIAGGFPLIAKFAVAVIVIEMITEKYKIRNVGVLWVLSGLLILLVLTFSSYKNIEFLYFRF